MTYAIGQKVDQQFVRGEASFDRACDEAYRLACLQFGLDDDGYLRNVADGERSTDAIVQQFIGYIRFGRQHQYTFVAWVERGDE